MIANVANAVAGPGVRALLFALAFVVLLVCAGEAEATIWSALNGFIDVSAVQAQIENTKEETLRQEYNVSLSHYLTPWVDFRVAATYFRFDQDVELLLGRYRQEFQPSGELRWNHPLFVLSTSGFYREVLTSNAVKITTEDLQGYVRTRESVDYPSVELRYSQQHVTSPDIQDHRDINNRRIQLNANYDTRHNALNYSFSHIESENVITDITATTDRHLFRWEGNGRMLGDTRSHLTGRYTFNYATVTNDVLGTGSVLEIAPISEGLYAQDDAPDQGALVPRPSLADGNKTDPAEPLIDIGGGNNNQNLGADLGLSQAVGGMYIYTDRPSGSQVRWLVYGSADNLNWQAFPGVPVQFFNPAFNRYELTFPAGEFRYIKAVNTDINEIVLVYITEIEVLRELPPDTREASFSAATHMLDGRISYEFSRRWESSLDLSFQADENIGRRGDRWRAGLGWRLFFDQSRTVGHHLRWNLSRQDGQAPQAKLTDSILGYTMTLNPLRTVRGTLALSDRLSYFNDVRDQNLFSTFLDGTATLYPGLNLSLGGGVSWFDNYILDIEYQTWQLRGGIDAELSRSLDIIFNYNYTETQQSQGFALRTRQLATFGADWRVTPDLYFRAALRYTAQRTRNWTQDYTLSFTVLPGLRLTGRFFEIETDDVRTSFRRSASLYWDLGRRNTIYLRVAEVDFVGSGEATRQSFQQGIRISF